MKTWIFLIPASFGILLLGTLLLLNQESTKAAAPASPISTPGALSALEQPLAESEAYLQNYLAKRDATKFIHLYDTAFRMGEQDLGREGNIVQAIRRLENGVPLPSGLKMAMEPIGPVRAHAAANHIKREGNRFILKDTAALNPVEKEILRRERSCDHGACIPCVDGSRANIKKLGALRQPL